MIGSCACTYRLGDGVIKSPRIDVDDPEITRDNVKAMRVEANVYTILGLHDRIARCLYISPMRDMVTLEFYDNGNLKDYVAKHGPSQLDKWTKQMVEGVAYVHSKGVRHSDLRLDQWLLDSGMNARLSDFNASGYDECSALGLSGETALGNEGLRHFMPRDALEDNSIRSDLFALGSALYELECGRAPYADVDEDTVVERFARYEFPPVATLKLRCFVIGAWKGCFDSATDMLQQLEEQQRSND